MSRKVLHEVMPLSNKLSQRNRPHQQWESTTLSVATILLLHYFWWSLFSLLSPSLGWLSKTVERRKRHNSPPVNPFGLLSANTISTGRVGKKATTTTTTNWKVLSLTVKTLWHPMDYRLHVWWLLSNEDGGEGIAKSFPISWDHGQCSFCVLFFVKSRKFKQ